MESLCNNAPPFHRSSEAARTDQAMNADTAQLPHALSCDFINILITYRKYKFKIS